MVYRELILLVYKMPPQASGWHYNEVIDKTYV